eukprot:663477-Amphidinium_carterae.1
MTSATQKTGMHGLSHVCAAPLPVGPWAQNKTTLHWVLLDQLRLHDYLRQIADGHSVHLDNLAPT